MSKLSELKTANRLEDVIEETGYPLKERGGGYWEGATINGEGLSIHVSRQRYYWGEESGDVIDWLKRRFGWGMKQVIAYLENRANTPEAERQAARGRAIELAKGADAKGQTEPVPPSVSVPKQAQKTKTKTGPELPYKAWEWVHLAWDYPGGLERLFKCESTRQALDEFYFWIPSRFTRLAGCFESDNCTFCYQDFTGWQDIYLGVEIGDSYELLHGGTGSGLYCEECYRKFQRWQKAINQLLPILREFIQGREG